MSEQKRTELTEKVLRCIASHLSGRQDCKGLEYAVTIGTEVDDTYMTFEPVRVRVFPNTYRRSESDKVSVAEHIIKTHFPELYLPDISSDYNLHVDTTKLVKGVYVYQCSVDKKRRRWVRVK